MAYTCEQCGVSFPKLSQLLRHRRTENHWKKFKCDVCGKVFQRKDNLDRHTAKHKQEDNYHCDQCNKVFSRLDSLQKHKAQKHAASGGQKRSAQDDMNDTVDKRLRQDVDPRQFYIINKVKEQRMEKFKTTQSTYRVTFRDIEVTDDIVAAIRTLFSAVLEDLVRGGSPTDLIRMAVHSSSLDFPIVIPFGPVPTLTADRFMSEIERVLQSNEDFVIDESLLFDVTYVQTPQGGAGKRCKYVNTEKFVVDKRCLIRIQNEDDMCCARALVTAKARLDQHEKWSTMRKGGKIQTRMATELHENANVPLGSCGIEEVKQFQSVFPGYQIHIISAEHFNSIIYAGPEADKKIYLYYHDNHYDIITSMAAFLSKSYFCTSCNKGYEHQERHQCNNRCPACHKIHAVEDTTSLHCETCNRFFRGQVCFELHIRTTPKGNSTCNTFYRCESCGKTVNRAKRRDAHICGETYCAVCKDYVGQGHLCYMLPDVQTSENTLDEDVDKENTYIFFDFECTQDDVLECDMGYKPDDQDKCQNCHKATCGAYEHRPNLCVAQKVCTECMATDTGEDCEQCGQKEYIFRGENTLEDFCTWLFSEDNYQSTVLCHNFQGYDSYPILQYLYKNATIPTVIPNGAKIMCLSVPACKVKMIDSINFLPMALAKLPSMFGFNELKKGYYPHLFNTKKNRHAKLNGLPDIKYYNPDAMKPSDREHFTTWYNEHKYDQFDAEAELLAYCKSDVDILRRCCLQFREDFMKITDIDPFDRCITIASACNLVFRAKFLEPETIAIIPHHGYNPEQKQSVKAMQWLKYISHKEKLNIQHARNGGEKVIGAYPVDGYYETTEGERVVLEFHGDLWHGNPHKYARSTINPVRQITMGDLYDKTLEKKKYLEDHGYTYKCIWESDFDLCMERDSDMKAFVDQLDIVTPLEPRDSFFGGRTEAFTVYKEASDEETINYYDVTSLYPFVNKTGKVPVGHPEIITENFEDIATYEGLVKCKVVPPRGKFHPVLPCKVNNKLLFHLCRSCAETQQQEPCYHTNEERALTGTWVTDEVKKALEKGYELVKMYEVWHFKDISQYDPDTKMGGLFTEYVNTFLKLKQEASGWPKWCKTEQDKQDYIDQYFEKEGIRLNYKNIKKNPGMRGLAKLMLNSFWGKFGQRPNMTQVDHIDDPSIYFDKLTSDKEEVTTVNFVSDEMVEIRWRYKDDFVDNQSKTNVVIAAYTTAQARLKLYSYLDKLGPRALYADTDSVVFTTKDGEWKPQLGDFLGDLTDEVPDNTIRSFVTGGPKNYAYQLATADERGNHTVCKVRGITLNYKNLTMVNFECIRRFVTEEPEGKLTLLDSHKITRDRDNVKLLTVKQQKDYRLVFDKRILRDSYVSYPYGY